MAMSVNLIILIPWFVFFIYWGMSVIYDVIRGKTKRTERRQSIIVTIFQNLFLYIAFILIYISSIAPYPLNIRLLPNSSIILVVGFALASAGIGFAIWARYQLGGNWSGTIQLKEHHTLVTTGPYGIVRHPIYSGITLLVIGSAIFAGNISGLLAIVSVAIFSLMRISAENKLMLTAFGKKYNEYSKRVKAYIPGVW
jgi:protein-S-isoprenylcysteine O-methyltransferase Ste14